MKREPELRKSFIRRMKRIAKQPSILVEDLDKLEEIFKKEIG